MFLKSFSVLQNQHTYPYAEHLPLVPQFELQEQSSIYVHEDCCIFHCILQENVPNQNQPLFLKIYINLFSICLYCIKKHGYICTRALIDYFPKNFQLRIIKIIVLVLFRDRMVQTNCLINLLCNDIKSFTACQLNTHGYLPQEILHLSFLKLPNELLIFKIVVFLFYPFHYYINKIILLNLRQLYTRLHIMPLSYAFPAAGSCCMLCNKYRMPFHRSLFPIIGYYRWGLPFSLALMIIPCSSISSLDTKYSN